MDTLNEFLVAVRGDDLVILNPPRYISKERALMFAAWIVALADPEHDTFAAALRAVESTW